MLEDDWTENYQQVSSVYFVKARHIPFLGVQVRNKL